MEGVEVPPGEPLLAEGHVRLLAAADTARNALQGSRSDRLLRLFDYLLDRTLAGEAPSEQQIAAEAFNDAGPAETSNDANVRVYVHRLRKILDGAFAGTAGPKLHIPVGEYRIRLDDDGYAANAPGFEPATLMAGPGWRRYARWVGLMAAALAIGLFGWWGLGPSTPPLAQTLVWQPFVGSERPMIFVVGDYYLFAKLDGPAADSEAAPQLVWDKDVPTREDLTILQMLDPARAHMVVDYNQQFVTGGTIEALSAVRAGFAQLPSSKRRPIRLVASSQLTPEMLKSSDIIYVGQFSGMRALLRDPLAQASGFRFDPGFDGLTDMASAKRYQSDGMVMTDDRIARRDFAYLASIPGPAGNRFLVIAGLGDAGLKEAAQLAGNLEQMKRLKLDPGRLRTGFEALYRVRTIKNVNVGAVPVLDRPLRSAGIWDNAGQVPPYRPFETKGTTVRD